MRDSFGREIDYMRISVTDRCNLRCVYCMPEEGVTPINHSQVLSYEEILRIARLASELGIRKIRLTGGEPLVRKGIEGLVRDIRALPGIDSMTITTNAVLLPEKLDALIDAGLSGINISLDTLIADKFEKITRREGFEKVVEAIDLCVNKGINTKVNCVAMMGVNDDEFVNMAMLAKDRDMCVRFIEYMPIGKNDFEKAVSMDEIKSMLTAELGGLVPDKNPHGSGPALYFKPSGFKGSVGFISAMSNCFCENCNRIRLTAEGYLKLCLQYDIGESLREPLRMGKSDDEIKRIISEAVLHKPKRHQFNNYKDAENVDENVMSRIGG